MDQLMLLQLGTGGMAWLLFTIGLLWCGFAWWRASRCRCAMACLIAAITSIVSAATMITMILTQIFWHSGPAGNGKLIEHLALGFFLLAGLSWAVSSLCFLLAASRSSYPKPEDLSPETPTTPQG